jgi:serine/threonine-protein kinase BUR1
MVPHSPPSMSHPPSRSPSGDGALADVFLPEKVIPKTGEKSKDLQPPHQPPRPIRPPLRRTREEEYKAYGRTFVGSGQQDDYDAMTKLGEGTFGYVLFSSTYV